MIVLAFFISTSPNSAPRPATAPEPTASSTLAVVSDTTAPPLTLPSIATSTSATTTKKSLPAVTPKRPAVTTAIPSAPALPPIASIPVTTDFDAAATTLRAALVNIICYAPIGSSLRSISGSGIIITSSGIILTNAHIAQNFLLADRGVSCTIRSGSPAVNKYEASLIFISPAWIAANANILTIQNPTGTGERDFAFLAITKSLTAVPLPATFPFVAPALTPSRAGTPVIIASYGAQFLQSNQIQSSLFPTIVYGLVKEVFTFGTNTIDVLALGGSAAAQEGSSGGGVANADGELVGTITTSTVEGDTSTRQLSAITLSYIRADYASETGSPLDLLLTAPVGVSIAAFAPQMKSLEAILTAHLP